MVTRYRLDDYDPLNDNEYWIAYAIPNSDTPEDIESAIVESPKD